MEELLLIAKIIATFYDFVQKAQSLLNPDPTSIRDMYNRLVAVEFNVARLESDVQNTSYELRRAEAIEITRAVDAERASYTAALQYSVDHPGETADEIAALAAADALANLSFYTFPGRTAGSPDRFDPRATLPSFLAAVGTWLSLRSLNKSPWTPTSKAALLGFAVRLEDLVARIRNAVVCIEIYGSYDHPLIPPPPPPKIPKKRSPDDPLPDPIPTEPRCSHRIECHDAMRETVEYPVAGDTPGYCQRNGSWTNPYQARLYLDSYYMPDKLQATAQGWRTLAS